MDGDDDKEEKRLSRSELEKRERVDRLSIKALMGSEDENGNANGLRLNGSAQQALPSIEKKRRKEREARSRLAMKLASRAYIKSMQNAVDDYVEQLNEEIAVLEIQRDELISDIDQLESKLQSIEGKRISIQNATDHVNSGEELELSEDGLKLKDAKLEEIVREYEKKRSTNIDRGDTALLLALLEAEKVSLKQAGNALEQVLSEKRDQLQNIQSDIEEREIAIVEAEQFDEALARISGIIDEADRERQMNDLLGNSSKRLLDNLAESPRIPHDVRAEIEAYLLEAEDVANEEALEAETFLSELDFDASDEAVNNDVGTISPKPFG